VAVLCNGIVLSGVNVGAPWPSTDVYVRSQRLGLRVVGVTSPRNGAHRGSNTGQ